MLFNSFEFIFVFLPIVLLFFYIFGMKGHKQVAVGWLVLCSLFFYGWWNPAYLLLIVLSMVANYSLGRRLHSERNQHYKKIILIIGVTLNLGLLGYYKYTNFLIDQINTFSDYAIQVNTIVLPLAISFFTFQQIAYLVDAYRNECHEYNALNYSLFVTFFPQLIAGPIVHHKEMMPQFSAANTFRVDQQRLALGITIFTLGLFKKVMIADNAAEYANPIFNAAEVGTALTFFDSWGGALAYTLQLYFDFSGYTDMAIGIAMLFGITLPMNFNSPYKAVNIIDFWRRWHITLSRFLRDYLYIALGGNRKGAVRRYINLFLTMLLGGIWHGAGWTFVIWGALHGTYLMVNHGWRKIRNDLLGWSPDASLWEISIARAITLLAVIVGWVYFRAESVSGANAMIYIMMGLDGISLPESWQHATNNMGTAIGISYNGIFSQAGASLDVGFGLLLGLFLFTIFGPNTVQIASFIFEPRRSSLYVYAGASVLGLCFFLSFSSLTKVSEFLYFNF